MLCGRYLLFWKTVRGLLFSHKQNTEKRQNDLQQVCVRPQRMLLGLDCPDKPQLGPLHLSPDPASHPSLCSTRATLHWSPVLGWSMLQVCLFSTLLLFFLCGLWISGVALFPALSLAVLSAAPGWTWFSPCLQAQRQKLSWWVVLSVCFGGRRAQFCAPL